MIRRVRFSDCDPAGIVFYPKYLIMFNDLLESCVDATFPEAFAGLISNRRVGTPVVKIEAEFTMISRFGDDLELTLLVEHLGRSSMKLRMKALCAKSGTLRMSALQTHVCTSLETHRAIPIPDELRLALSRYATVQEAV